jgi:hypothetical protein
MTYQLNQMKISYQIEPVFEQINLNFIKKKKIPILMTNLMNDTKIS